MPGRELDVVLYGATGYTGRLVAKDLARQGARFGIAGRSRDRLEGLREDLDAQPPVFEANIEDHPALVDLAERAPVLASAAGPFKDLGPPVFEAALEAGSHFVDTTGEQGYLRWASQQHERARDHEVTAVNATGFDVVPSDMAAVLSTRPLDDAETVEIALSTNSRLSDGTQRTMAATTGDWWEYKDGSYKNAVPGRHARTFPFPDKDEDAWGIFIPWGDVATAPRSTGARNVRTYFVLPEDRVKRYHRLWPLQALVSKLPFLDRLLKARAPDERDGPSPEDRDDSWFTILAEARSPSGERSHAIVEGKDPYGLTGAATSRTALALARDEVDEHGVLTPMQAFEPDQAQKMLPEYLHDARVLEPPE